jgi:hypothetical protein
MNISESFLIDLVALTQASTTFLRLASLALIDKLFIGLLAYLPYHDCGTLLSIVYF